MILKLLVMILDIKHHVQQYSHFNEITFLLGFSLKKIIKYKKINFIKIQIFIYNSAFSKFNFKCKIPLLIIITNFQS